MSYLNYMVSVHIVQKILVIKKYIFKRYGMKYYSGNIFIGTAPNVHDFFLNKKVVKIEFVVSLFPMSH